jgi:hypothetical protein
MSEVPLHEEIINEIGTQTLAKFGLNIFNLNTYAGYEESVKGSVNVFDAYNKHKNNPNYFGQTFEDLDVTQRNIDAAMHNKDERYATTDNLGDINDPITDVRKLSSDGEVLENYQHKVIKDSAGLFGKNNKYLQNDKIVVAKDDYERHKNYLENMIQNTKDEETRKNAKELLNKLEASEISREEAINARTTSVKIQATQAGNHIIQTGVSDAVIVALSTLANGAIFEIKDAFKNDNNVSISQRVKRLLKKVLDEFYKIFKRGASYGTLEVGIGILSQIFKSFSSKIMSIWKTIRKSAKSIFNAIYSYIVGEIKSYKALLSTIIKGLLSAIMVVGTVAIEAQLETFLAPLVTPLVASYLAPALAIVIGSIAVVISMKSVDVALNALFGVFAKANLAKMRAEKIKEICAELLPDLIAEKEELKELIHKTYKKRKLTFEKSFYEFRQGLTNHDISSIICGLENINSIYSKKLQFQTFKEFDNFMCSDDSFKL